MLKPRQHLTLKILMLDPYELAAELYSTYCQSVGGVAYNGDPLPTWEEFIADPAKATQAEGWVDVAREAITQIG